MHRFVDNKDRLWTITITVTDIKRVRALCDVDLLEAVDGALLERLVSDPITLCNILFALCKPQADTTGVTDEQFGEGLAGDALDQATEAFLEELVDFFPARRRDLLRGALQKMREVENRALALAKERLDNPALLREVDKILSESGSSFGNAPVDVPLTPIP